MAVFWFLAGAVTTVAALIIATPWLRKWPRLGSLPLLPWQASLGAGLVVLAVFGSSHWLGMGGAATSSGVAAPGNIAAGAFGSAVQVYDRATDGSAMAAGSAGNMPGAANAGAGSMDSAIANLEARLAKGGGSADDWELLAKAFEFLGRPADAAKARAHQLPAPGANPDAATAKSSAAAAAGSGTVVSGEIELASSLAGKAKAGEALFIFAKSMASPGPPVAVYRSSVGRWPVKFRLDDSQSMLPGRNLSNAGRVTVEARISQSGQPLPSAGDLEGSSGTIDPADQKPLKILINRVVP